MSAPEYQIAIVGSGFAGSLIAMIARRLGFSVCMIERGRHPRFAIGESSTPLANLLLEELAVEFDLPFLLPFCKWGSWQETYPQIGCGLKRGFTFYHHQLGNPFKINSDHANQLMVGASPSEKIADTHWYRPDFDRFLVGKAQELGVIYHDETELEGTAEENYGIRLRGQQHGKPFHLTVGFVIDASGPRGFLHRALGLSEKPLCDFPSTQALFSHFNGVRPLGEDFTAGTPPYPPEQAAVHHVFDGGWIWVLKFNNGLTSAGVVATSQIAEQFQFKSGEAAWRNLLPQLPSLAQSFDSARAVTPFVWQPRVAFQNASVIGRNWVLLPSAAGVVDPLLSTGFPLTLLGVQRLARLLKTRSATPLESDLDDYAQLTILELETTARLVKVLYSTMNQFDAFKELTLLYFAAASFSETTRRLGKPSQDFLLCRHPVFAPQLRLLCESPSGNLNDRVRQAIEPIDVAGLTNRSRHPWYPALASDLFANAHKVGATEAEILTMLKRCGFSC